MVQTRLTEYVVSQEAGAAPPTESECSNKLADGIDVTSVTPPPPKRASKKGSRKASKKLTDETSVTPPPSKRAPKKGSREGTKKLKKKRATKKNKLAKKLPSNHYQMLTVQ